MKLLRNCVSLLIIALFFSCTMPSAARAEIKKLNILGSMILSAHGLMTGGDRIALDMECRHIADGLTTEAIETIESDPELRTLYKEFSGFLKKRVLSSEEREHFYSLYNLRAKKRLVAALTGVKPYGLGQWEFMGNILISSPPAYFGYADAGKELSEKLDAEVRQLRKEDIAQLRGSIKRMTETYNIMVREGKMPDERRLTKERLDNLYSAIHGENQAEQLEFFKKLEPYFKSFPQFWYFYGTAAEHDGELELSARCFDEFENVYIPIFKIDPYKLEVSKRRVSGLIANKASFDETAVPLKSIRVNTSDEDWSSSLFAAVMYFAAGDKDTAEELLSSSVEFGSEKELGKLLLESMKNGKLNVTSLSKEFKTIVTTKNEGEEEDSLDIPGVDKELVNGLKAWFEERDNEAAEIFSAMVKDETCKNSIPYYILSIMYNEGAGVAKDIKKSQKLYKIRATLIKESSLLNAVLLPFVEKYAVKGKVRAEHFLGAMFMEGDGVPQDYAKAFEWYTKADEHGHIRAKQNLGYIYYTGKGVPVDYAKAFEWYKKAAEQGDVTAQFMLGSMHYNGEGVQQDYVKAFEWYTKAAEQGLANAQYKLGYMYSLGRGAPVNYEKTLEWYKKADEQGLVDAQYKLGYMYYYGDGVPQDYAKAFEWYKKADEQGLAEAQYDLGEMYYYGKGVQQDYLKAFECYLKAAGQGHARAQTEVGTQYCRGEGTPQDYNKAIEWYTKAADQGDTDAQYYLSDIYYYGKGVQRDCMKAAEWCIKATGEGNISAQELLGDMYCSGCGVPQDYEKAVECYSKLGVEFNEYQLAYAQSKLDGTAESQEQVKIIDECIKAAEQGNAEAQHELGYMYYNGKGVQRDYAKAAEWYSRAAEQEYAEAQYNLGNMYRNSYGVPFNYTKALELYSKAVKNSKKKDFVYVFGISRIAEMYKKGLGVKKDEKKIFELYLSIAEGSSTTQNELGSMCERGEGVKKSAYDAYVWYYLSYLTEKDNNEDAEKGMVSSKKSLSNAQIKEAQKKAQAMYDASKAKK